MCHGACAVDSIAAKAGISAHDVVVAIDGIKADTKQLATLSKATRAVECHLFRRDELMTVKVLPKSDFADKDANDDNEKAFPHSVSLRLARASTDCEGDAKSPDYANTEKA